MNITEAKIYVSTYAKYNRGSLCGDWVTLSDYDSKDEFIEACRQLHADEDDPEFMFQDYEDIPEGLISEAYINPKFWDLVDTLIYADEEEQQAFMAYIECFSVDIAHGDLHALYANFQDSFRGVYDSEEDFAEQIIKETEDLPEWAERYFDYGAYARDLFYDYAFLDGLVFRR